MSRRKEDDMSFDIKRAYEKWLEEGQPIQGDEATEKKETGRQSSEKANRKQAASADSRERDRKSGRRDRGADNRKGTFRGDSRSDSRGDSRSDSHGDSRSESRGDFRRKSPASRTGMRAVRGLPGRARGECLDHRPLAVPGRRRYRRIYTGPAPHTER